MNIERFYSNGKLLLTGEYVVLDGAKAIALPTQCGQSLTVAEQDDEILNWQSYDFDNSIWLEAQFPPDRLRGSLVNETDDTKKRLLQIIIAAMELNPLFLKNNSKGYKVTTYLDFNRSWGLGTSSTLINNIAQWSKTDPYRLLHKTFGGSGYDIACSYTNYPILYELHGHLDHSISKIDFNPVFKDQLYFVFLNKKQSSRDAIKEYEHQKPKLKTAIQDINGISQNVVDCNSLADFEQLMQKHELIISNITGKKPIKEVLFNDFPGVVKSLGAWGGDFVLATSKENPSEYFKSKGYNVVVPYSKLILN